MGFSVFSQCDRRQYFSISRIDEDIMRELGFNITKKQLQEMARREPPFAEIYTGQARDFGHRQKTKIWRYKDFLEAK